MACSYPLAAYRLADSVRTDKLGRVYRSRVPGLTFNPSKSDGGSVVWLPCGKCLACRLDWSMDWAVRCEKEAQLYDKNAFITLTYNDEHLPIGGSTRSSLSKREWQLFMKRLRKEFGDGIRYFASGEYGPKTQRAHYHALLFNHDFPDKRLWRSSRGNNLYVSATLERLWPFGFSSIGGVSLRSAGYVARYVLKKLSGQLAEVEYADREPPFVLMSRRPGIGSAWLRIHEADVYGPGADGAPRREIVTGDGRVRRPPRYFDKEFAKTWPAQDRLTVFSQVSESRAVLSPQERRRRGDAREAILLSKANLAKGEL